MKKSIVAFACFGSCLLFLQFFSGCIKDKINHTYTIYTPVYKTLTQVRTEMKGGAAQPLQHTGKLNVYNNYIFLNEVEKGIHVIDNSDPAAPKNVAFITIPGNEDLVVKGNYLYADSYSDLVVFDITAPNNIAPKKFVDRIFTDRNYYWGNTLNPDSVNVITGYTQKDTTVNMATYTMWSNCYNCSYASASGNMFTVNPASSVATAGTSGSMSRLAVINNYLYGVSASELLSLDISEGGAPQLANRTSVGSWSIETIYPFQNKLFIGSTSGMFMYDVNDPARPAAIGQFSHLRSCDPVVADNTYAFVTLRSGTACQGFSNELDILNLAQTNQPSLVKTYSMTNPHGLAKDGDLLFICDGKDGLKIYNAADVNNLKLLKTFGSMETFDIVAQNGKAIVVAKDGLYQFDYSKTADIHQVSKINILN